MIPEMSDDELLKMAESWIQAEIRRCKSKLGLTPVQLMRVVLRVTGKVTEDYLKTIKEDDETQPES